jgi:hypothetical protein
MGRACELAEPVNGLARKKISRAPILGLFRMVQVPARAVETGRTRTPSTGNPSRRRHPLLSSGEELNHLSATDRWREGAAPRASAAAVLVGEEEEAGVAGEHPAATRRRTGAASVPSRPRSGRAGGGPTGERPPTVATPPTPSACAWHRRELVSRCSAFLLHRRHGTSGRPPPRPRRPIPSSAGAAVTWRKRPSSLRP